MSSTDFDPAAWVRAYERLGANVHIIRQRDGTLWLGKTIPRTDYKRRNELLEELSADPANDAALFDYIKRTRGVIG